MAHNSLIRASWIALSDLQAAEMQLFDVAQFKSINGDDGGTWAPSARIIIGGSGIRMTGLLEIHASAEIEVAGFLTTDAGSLSTFGDAAVFNGTATFNAATTFRYDFTVNNSANGTFANGSALLFDNGVGLGVLINGSGQSFASGTLLELASGAAGQVDSGATWKFYGTATVESGGEIEVKSGGTLLCDAGSSIQFNEVAHLAAGGIVAGPLSHTGSTAYTVQRLSAGGAGASINMDTTADLWRVHDTLGADQVIALQDPPSSEVVVIRVFRSDLNAAAHIVTIIDTHGNTYAQFPSAGSPNNFASADFVFDPVIATWRICGLGGCAFSIAGAP